jgi:hypothetical protein
MPKGADIDLGTPGASMPTTKPRTPVEDVPLGAAGAQAARPPVAAAKSDVSLDLADHMGLKPADVKEAVRQSKQMSAVEVPKELLAAIDTPVPPSKVDAPKPVAKVDAPKPVAKPVEAPKPIDAPKPVTKPIETPKLSVTEKKPVVDKPVVVAEKKPIPTAPKQGVSPMLIILLVLAIGGAGAYFAWRYLLRGKAEQTSQVTPPPVTPGSGSVEAPVTPAAPPPKAKIEITPGAPRDILSVFAGTVETIDPTERDVDTSDVIARLVGAKRTEAEIAALDKEIERRMTTLKNAESVREKLNPAPVEDAGSGSAAPPPKAPSEAQVKAADAAIAKAHKALEDKQNERGTKEEDLEKLYVRAPFEGHLIVVAKPGQKIEENTPIAKITPKPAPTALFKLDRNMTLDRGLAVPIRVNEKMYTCEVAESNVDGTLVVCRTMTEGLTEGAEATLLVEQN